MRTSRLLLTLCTCILLLSGCGQNATGIKISNLTNYEKTTPDSKYDPQTLANADAVLANLNIVDRSGKQVHLNLGDKPILFEAYWCPHCQRTLLLFQHNETLSKSKPVVISCGFPKNTTLKDAVAASDKEFTLLGLSGFTVYYVVEPIQVPGYPSLLFQKDQSVNVLIGEHSANVWERAVLND